MTLGAWVCIVYGIYIYIYKRTEFGSIAKGRYMVDS